VGAAAVDLPWLCPQTDSLIALAESPATVEGLSATDPGLSLFLLRFADPAAEPAPLGFAPGALLSSRLPETAAAFLSATSAGVLPGVSLTLNKLRAVAARAGAIAAGLADHTRRCPAAVVGTVSRLSPLGWYAAFAVDSFAAAEPLGDPAFPADPATVQKEVWGLDQAAITRRLATRWKLPARVAATLGSLEHPLSVASFSVEDTDLFAVVQLAVLESQREGGEFGLTRHANRDELLGHLELEDAVVRDIVARSAHVGQTAGCSGLDQNPHNTPLLKNLLKTAGESRRRNGPALVVRLEEQIDGLHTALAGLGELVGERLRAAKLNGLAELAAGAGHEINNPLAVISGNAQRLLRTEQDLDRADSLRAIVRQAHRISGILRDLMQFARPPHPTVRALLLSELVLGARDEQAPFAQEREIHLELKGAMAGVWVQGDMKQLRHALAAVIRNGIDAAQPGGWVRISIHDGEGEQVAVTVEDSGPGLNPDAVEHAFDPFYCGRSAGRGRGLGLPTAWQLVRQNGGELKYEPVEGEPTRFSFTLCKSHQRDVLSLRSAC
jgi:signal transduction histidine kinase